MTGAATRPGEVLTPQPTGVEALQAGFDPWECAGQMCADDVSSVDCAGSKAAVHIVPSMAEGFEAGEGRVADVVHRCRPRRGR